MLAENENLNKHSASGCSFSIAVKASTAYTTEIISGLEAPDDHADLLAKGIEFIRKHDRK